MKISFNQEKYNINFDKELKDFFKSKYDVNNLYLTTSCSSALQMAAEVIDIKPGDEVILPSFTYVTTAMGFFKRGAKLVFADIDPLTYVLDIEDIKRKITRNTKAIVPMHYAGISMDLDKLSSIAREKKIYIIEDAAQCINARYKDRFLGTIGDIGTYSFHHTKNISTGEGGALLLNNNRLLDRANIIYEKGTDRHAFINGEIDHYSWIDVGGSYGMSNYLKEILNNQLKQMEFIQNQRKRVHIRYMKNLKNLGLQLPKTPGYSKSNYHIFSILLNNINERDNVIKKMKDNGIQTSFHYQPLHLSMFGKKMGYDKLKLPVTEHVADCILRLPIYPTLTDEAVDYITDSLIKIMEDYI